MKVLFTQEGYDAIQKEYRNLTEARKPIVEEVARTSALGDRSENGAYRAAKSALSRTDSRLRYLKKAIDAARIIDNPQEGVVSIGSYVKLLDGDHVHHYHIVGSYESDISAGKISYLTPLGKVLLHKKEGETVKLELPSGVRNYKIEKASVEPIENF